MPNQDELTKDEMVPITAPEGAKDGRTPVEYYIEKAKKVAAQLLTERKNAPKGVRAGMTVEEDPLLRLIRIHVPEALPKHTRKHGQRQRPGNYKQGATMSVMTDYPGENWGRFKKHCEEGWEPVVDKKTGELVYRGADILFKRDIVFEREKIMKAQKLHFERLKDADPNKIKRGVDDDAIDDTVTVSKRKSA